MRCVCVCSLRVKNYKNRPDLDRIRYCGEWTIICTKRHVHTKRCQAAATGKGRVRLAPRKPGEPEEVLEGFFDEGRPSTEAEVNPVFEYEERIDLEEQTALTPQLTPVPQMHRMSRKRARSDGSCRYEPLQLIKPLPLASSRPSPPVSSIVPSFASSSAQAAAAATPLPDSSVSSAPSSSSVELWYPSEGVPGAHKMRLFRIESGSSALLLHLKDAAERIGRHPSYVRSKLAMPSERKLVTVGTRYRQCIARRCVCGSVRNQALIRL